ncbi:hypothetical protein SDC9_195780 [bioreactor metagenome]|uniref:Uncharacterized protein n=1 Tax=bioreactor metagenome TaxID=1076179 RepID=A0A645IA01_9ZZZZ
MVRLLSMVYLQQNNYYYFVFLTLKNYLVRLIETLQKSFFRQVIVYFARMLLLFYIVSNLLEVFYKYQDNYLFFL